MTLYTCTDYLTWPDNEAGEIVVSDPQKLDARGMRGAPDWVAEVLSPRTAHHDRAVKLPVYERAGVREVWLVDPIDRTLAMTTRP